MRKSEFPFPGLENPGVFEHRVQAFKEGVMYALNNAINGVNLQDLVTNLQSIAEINQRCFAYVGEEDASGDCGS